MRANHRPSLAPEGASVHYERHRPEQTTLYRLVQAARRDLLRRGRSRRRSRPAAVRQGRVRRLSLMRHPGPRLPEAARRRLRPRQAGRLQLQAPRVLHCLVLDGVYRRASHGEPVFVEVPAPSDEALQAVLHKIIAAILQAPVIERILTHLGVQARAPPQAPARGSQLRCGPWGSAASETLWDGSKRPDRPGSARRRPQ
jgi:hypothetical protein